VSVWSVIEIVQSWGKKEEKEEEEEEGVVVVVVVVVEEEEGGGDRVRVSGEGSDCSSEQE
jgi:hypothetical protein